MISIDLSGKNYIITGSSKGIGLGIAEVLLNAGANILINSRSEDDLIALREKYPEILIFSGDLTSEEAANNLFKFANSKWNKVDGLICNIGSGKSVPPLDEDFNEWTRVINLNLLTATNCVRASISSLEKSKGSIVCISSICGHEALGAPLAYSSAKAALNSFVKGSSRELAKKGIRINAISPGNIMFKGSTWEDKLNKNKENVLKIIEDNVPMNRFGTPEEIGNAVLFYISKLSTFCTGSILVVDGGQTRS